MKKRIPRQFKKYDKMGDPEFYEFIRKEYGYFLTFVYEKHITGKEIKKYVVDNYFGKNIITADSKSMVAYWLAIFK